ncbi:hypothetical protein HYFRA_00007885 [Hymenoscyphus fraxineus]|uniref:BTB domain-containing protein n=1 Tax=Hymenoscyphus fraxineus TaxID=746836 RepID=A0A9N9KME6_9HELO|nr:hypothetical protein HYFRA_00007885 [Hymenoscyphus fraxineus]
MVVERVAQNAQRQRLTVTLKNICRDYPAGGGVLREYEETHSAAPLQSPCLAKFQGPALLAYNSALFTESDFVSLSQLGESLKHDDGSTTGKFGRGFNTVYNYTDSPSILSGDQFTMLDPHQEWSEGGDRFNFVKGADDAGMKNHMAAFRAIMKDPKKRFDGTIIRIPLRTKEHAIKSGISDKETTIKDIKEVLKNFADEFGKSGLLFMKNVESISIGSTFGPSIKLFVCDEAKVRMNKIKVNEAIKKSLQNSHFSFEHSFQVSLTSDYGDGQPKHGRFQIYHSIRGDLMNNKMRQWAAKERLVPWVGIATSVDCPTDFNGSLFTVLPLPISINQPVHIHGLFSLSPDRARLLTLADTLIQEKSPAEWNEWLLRHIIPITWAKLLESLATNWTKPLEYSAGSGGSVDIFNSWPREASKGDLLLYALNDVAQFINKERLRVWPIKDGFVSETKCLMEGNKSIQLQEAIYSAIGQVVFAPRWLLPTIRAAFNCFGACEIVEKMIIPKWGESGAANWGSECKTQLAPFVLSQFQGLSAKAKATLRVIPMISVRSFAKETSRFASAAELIDPTNSDLANLFFDEEEVLPNKELFEKFPDELRACGLITKLDRDLLCSRIRYYAHCSQQIFPVLQERVRMLLSLSCPSIGTFDDASVSDVRDSTWIPIKTEGSFLLQPPRRCRWRDDKLLVDTQMPIYSQKPSLSKDWRTLLGWNEVLPSHVLVSQLRHGIEKQNTQIVNAILRYMAAKKEPSQWNQDLRSIPFVLAHGTKEFVTTENVLCPPKAPRFSCERLWPYLANVDWSFWQEHERILRHFGISEGPKADDLLGLLNRLHSKTEETQTPLNTSDLSVAVEAVKLLSREPRELLQGIKIPNTKGYLIPIEKICYLDRADIALTNPPDITHSELPSSTIQALKIESLNEWVIRGILKIEEDEDLFDQHEETTTRIRDTLSRYSIDSTFREYLANADDAHPATKISWLLDKRTHPSKKLVSKNLESYQGPALLVYNDGIFSEKNFEGFRNVGVGSKQQDATSIGQFGRGSQTMYHWTDVPMVLSKNYLVILDPRQTSLNINPHTGKRKPGVKIELSLLKQFPDQLAPFDGLWNFDKTMDTFPGTIFRFPLRQGSSELIPMSNSPALTPELVTQKLGDYFHEARKSLLFLKRIETIEFKIQDNPTSGWSVSRPPPQPDAPITQFLCSYTRQSGFKQEFSGQDEWCVATEDLDKRPTLCDSGSHIVQKNIECSVAVLISSEAKLPSLHVKPPKTPRPGFFKTLPLQIPSDVPVHVHATFDMSGDRQSVDLDAERHPEHATYNKHLLQEVIPEVYLGLMAHLAMTLRPQYDVFQFWPKKPAVSKLNCSDLIASAFWDKLDGNQNSLFRKASLTTGNRRKLPDPPFRLREAVFDFLPREQSDLLAPLLLASGVNLVREIPEYFKESLVELDVQEVSGELLRKLFKSGLASKYLEGQKNKNNTVLSAIYAIIIPDSPDQFEELDGCHILPVIDGILAEISLLDKEKKKTTYYLASEAEATLFDFASSLLVPPSYHKTFRPLVVTEKFNLADLEPCSIGHLLKLRHKPLTDVWLNGFWKYCNALFERAKKSSSVTEDDIKSLGVVFKSTCNGIEQYKQFSDLGILPAIVDPDDMEQRKLCSKIPGLHIFDSSLMHHQLKESEASLLSSASFLRFIQALRKLSIQKHQPCVGQFLRQYLNDNDFKLLGEIVIRHVDSGVFDAVKSDLRTIPLWPRWGTMTAVASCDALIAEDPRFLVPWMKHSSQILDPSFSSAHRVYLKLLGVETFSKFKLLQNCILPFPSNMSASNWQEYQTFIHNMRGFCFDHDLRSALLGWSIAPDQKRNWHQPKDLYDHNDTIFQAAFRHQPDERFIHTDVRMQDFPQFWLVLGLRHRKQGIFDPKDYQECISSIDRRLQTSTIDRPLLEDVQVVLRPLTDDSQEALHLFHDNPHTWAYVLTCKVFPSRNNFGLEPEYRKGGMQQLAQKTPLLSMSNVVSYKYASICWSQTAFPREGYEPTERNLSLASSQSKGKPSLDLVWRHLKHLSGLGASLRPDLTREFLKDLHATYTYLQDHLDYQSPLPTSVNTKVEPLWLNIASSPLDFATVETVSGSWVKITDLVLSSSCDAGSIQAIKPSLTHYERLLKAMGCRFVIHPVVNIPALELDHDIGEALRGMRKSGDGLDITFQSEGKEIRAHRLVLGAISNKWKRQSYGHFPLEGIIQFSEDDPETFISYHTLSVMIDYAYGEKIDWTSMEVTEAEKHDMDAKAEKLNLLLDICHGAEFWLFPNLKVIAETKILTSGREFITIENGFVVLERAKEANAKALIKLCNDFIEQNRETMERAKEQVQE